MSSANKPLGVEKNRIATRLWRQGLMALLFLAPCLAQAEQPSAAGEWLVASSTQAAFTPVPVSFEESLPDYLPTQSPSDALDDERLEAVRGMGSEAGEAVPTTNTAVILWDEPGRRGQGRSVQVQDTGTGNVQTTTLRLNRVW